MAKRMDIATKRGNDGGDVVVDHADVGALVRAGIAQAVGVERAAKLHRVPACGGALDERLHALVGHARFREDGGNLALDNEVDEATYIVKAGF